MTLIHTGTGYPGEVISAAVIAFLVLLVAFIALIAAIACRYHATKRTSTAAVNWPSSLGAEVVKPEGSQLHVTHTDHR